MSTTQAPDLQGLGSFIRDRRRSLGLTQTELAARVGVLQERISILEHGKYGTPSLQSLARLGAALETSLIQLLEAAGYTDLAVSAAEVKRPAGPAPRPAPPGGTGPPGGGGDAVETSGLSALLASGPGPEFLRLALRCNGRRYEATIERTSTDWVLTLVDVEGGRDTVRDGEGLASRDQAILAALLEVLRAGIPRLLDCSAAADGAAPRRP